MAIPSGVPREQVRRVAGAQLRLEMLIDGLSDAMVTQPTLLPGWSVGHVLTHVARNADSHRHRAEAAARGEVIDQYPGGFDGRAQEIDAGASRNASVIVVDVRESSEALRRAWEHVPLMAWNNPTRDVYGRERPLRSLIARRWQELEVHAIDLPLGATHRDWSAEFIDAWLPRLRAGVDHRLPEGATVPKTPVLDERDELAWLYGRLQPDGYPVLDPWG